MAEPDKKPADRGPLPDDGLEKIGEAVMRAKDHLAPEAQRQLAELWTVDSLFTVAVLLAVWAGFSLLTPLGWAVDIALGLYAAMSIGSELLQLFDATAKAAKATNDAELDQAAKALAQSFVAFGVDAVAGVVGGFAFGKLRAGLRGIRAKFFRRAELKSYRVGAGGRLLEVAGAAGLPVTAIQPEVRRAGGELRRALNWGLPVAGVVTIGVGLYLLGRKR